MRRGLSEIEIKQLRIAKTYHEDILLQKPNIVKIFFQLLLVVLCILYIVFFDNHWSSLLAKIAIVFLPIIYWLSYKDFNNKKEKANKVLNFIEKIENESTIEYKKYTISRALYFPIFEDEGDCYALETENGKILFLWDYIHFDSPRVFPSTSIEVFKNELAIEIFGRNIISTGNYITPIIIPAATKWKILNLIPKNYSVIDGTINDFLEKIEAEIKKY